MRHEMTKMPAMTPTTTPTTDDETTSRARVNRFVYKSVGCSPIKIARLSQRHLVCRQSTRIPQFEYLIRFWLCVQSQQAAAAAGRWEVQCHDDAPAATQTAGLWRKVTPMWIVIVHPSGGAARRWCYSSDLICNNSTRCDGSIDMGEFMIAATSKQWEIPLHREVLLRLRQGRRCAGRKHQRNRVDFQQVWSVRGGNFPMPVNCYAPVGW